MKYILGLIFSISVVFCYSQDKGTMKYVDVKYGFKEIKLEQSIEDLRKYIKIKKTDSGDGLDYYDIIDQRYFSVGDCKIKSVFITTFTNKVNNIVIQTDNTSNSKCILGTLTELYGRGFQDNEFIERYSWFGDKSIVMYKENSVDNSSIISISSKIMSKTYDDYLKSRRDKGSKDF